MLKKQKFDVLDYIVFVIILIISVLIGLFFGLDLNEKFSGYLKRLRSTKVMASKLASSTTTDNDDDVIKMKQMNENDTNTDENDDVNLNSASKSKTMNYFTANSSMGAFPIALSLLATFFSSSSLIGIPAEIYENGIQYFVLVFGVIFVPLIGAFLTGPFFTNLKIVSVFEYLKLRYNSEYARILVVTLYLIRTFIAMGIVIYGPATALSLLTDLTTEWSILLIGVIATFYTTIGGIKAVIWTDAFQIIIMFGGMISALVKGVFDVDGFGNLFEISREGQRLNLFDFRFDPLLRQSFWSLVFGSFVAWLMAYALDQQMLQRYSAAKNKTNAQVALLLNIPGIIFLFGICCFCGLVVYANYAKCDPVLNGSSANLVNYNQLLPYFVLDKFNSIPGIPGLFLSSIFCASLSSVSSGLNSMSACIWRDYLRSFRYFANFTDNKAATLNKIIVLIDGVVCTAFAFIIAQLGSNLIQISNTINGALQAPIIGVFVLSCMFPFANIYGLFSGAVCGFAITVWISIGSFITKPKYSKPPVSIENCSIPTSTITAAINASTNWKYTLSYEHERLYGVSNNLSGFDRLYSLSYQWLSPLGVITTVLVGILVSLLFKHLIMKNNARLRTRIDDDLILYRWFSNRNKIRVEKIDE